MNVIVGENNVGKSNLLRAINFLRTLPIGPVPASWWPEGKAKGSLSASITLQLEPKELEAIENALRRDPNYKIADSIQQYFGNNIEHKATWNHPDMAPEYELSFKRILGKPTARINPSYGNTYLPTSEAPIFGGPIHSMLVHSLDESFINFPEFRQRPSTSASEVLRSTEGSNVASVLFLLKNGDRQDQYRFRMIKHYFTLLFPTLRLEVRKPPQDQPRIVVEKRVTHHELPLDWIGAGIAEMIIILTHIVAERHKVIVLDEPELHLHPHSQRLLRDFLRQASKLNQIIVVTHSPQFVDPQNTESIIVVREITARSHIRKLAKNFLTEAQEHKVSQNLLAQEKEFLFSRSVLLVEGPTEYGAMSILAKRMKKGFDENGVSLVSVEGNYFGLMIRLLRGLGFSWSVMCDRDAVANISRGSIKVDGKEIKTSQVFHSLHDAGLLSPSEISELHHAQSQITLSKKGKSSAETYPVAQVTTLSKIAAAHRFNVLPTDFEGLFSKEGQGQLLRRAQEAYGRTKRLQGIYLAQYVKTVPLELRRVILQVTSSQ